MNKLSPIVALLGLLVVVLPSVNRADDTKPVPAAPTTATFLITGLHCRPCTSTLEASLAKVKGVKSAKVDWDTKNAKLTFDEGVVSSANIASAIAATPHMMGRDLHYGGWLALSVPEIGDDAVSKKVTEAIGKVKGVAKVVPYPKQKAVGIAFSSDGTVSSKALIDALASAGIKASNY